VLVHMRRSPDTRLFSTGVRRRSLLAQLPDPDTLARSLGTHLSAQIRSVRADLGEDPGAGGWTAAQEAFGEYESLNAQLNYRHAELRHAAEAGNIDVRGLRKLQKNFKMIGADGDAARVPLIQGAETAFTLPDVARGLWRIDMTVWHRCRLLVVFATRRAVYGLRATARRAGA
jgi:hypothetical protein